MSNQHSLHPKIAVQLLPSLNQDNSGIAPNRHKIHNLLNEHYASMYMM